VAEDTKVGLRLRAVVESEHRLDHALQLRREGDRALADTVGDAVERLLHQQNPEGLLHGRDGATELDDAVTGGRGSGHDG
jgi:hypothetical protein